VALGEVKTKEIGVLLREMSLTTEKSSDVRCAKAEADKVSDHIRLEVSRFKTSSTDTPG
jgi:hypothetical protein